MTSFKRARSPRRHVLRNCVLSWKTRQASSPARRRRCARSASGFGTSPSSQKAAAAAADALAPDEGDGAAGLVANAERALAPVESLAPELARAGDELRDAELRLREAASELRGFLTTLEAEPGRLEQLEADLDRIADAKRRFRVASYEELLARAAAARAELEAIDDGFDPAAAAAKALAVAEQSVRELADALRAARHDAAPRFAAAVAQELVGVGMGRASSSQSSRT